MENLFGKSLCYNFLEISLVRLLRGFLGDLLLWIFDEVLRWTFFKIIFDELFWKTFLMNFFERHFWWTFLKDIFDELFWITFLMNCFERHFWWTVLKYILGSTLLVIILEKKYVFPISHIFQKTFAKNFF